jgi:ABC-2 type transport system permease protein
MKPTGDSAALPLAVPVPAAAPVPGRARRAASLPSVLSIGLARAAYELRLFFRRKEAVFFTFLFPVMFLVLFGLVFGNNDVEGTDLRYAQVLVAGIMASGLMSVTFVNLAIGITTERDEGALKRLAGTPMPKASYFIGKIGMVLVCVLAEIALLMVIGLLFFDLRLPTAPSRWLTFAWVLVLGTIASTMLGVAASSVPRSAKSAAAVINLPFVALQFISGVYVPYSELSSTVRFVASVFPLKWIAQGFRSVFLPDAFLRNEPGGSWQHGQMALVLIAWSIVGAIVCARTFRWSADRSE